MTATDSAPERSPASGGAILFSYGFRPFFLSAALYGAILILAWVPWFLGFIDLPTDFPQLAWHSHELLFGYVAAAIAGFLLTAVANWTNRAPVSGSLLAALFALWLLGRVAVSMSSVIGLPAMSVICLAFPISLAVVFGREIIAARNWRNVKVLFVLVVFIAAQCVFHWEVWRFGHTVVADRFAIATVILLVMLIGGRIIPVFTGNWLKARGASDAPPAFNRTDGFAMVVGILSLAVWAAAPIDLVSTKITGVLLLLAAVVHLVRQARWHPFSTFAEPLVTVLHAAYLFIPVGFALAGIGALAAHPGAAAAAIHAFTVGAIAAMTLSVMTRASLGHTGRALTASPATVVIFVSVIVAAGLRIAAALYPQGTMILVPLAALGWIAAFLGFVVVYGPMLLTPRV